MGIEPKAVTLVIIDRKETAAPTPVEEESTTTENSYWDVPGTETETDGGAANSSGSSYWDVVPSAPESSANHSTVTGTTTNSSTNNNYSDEMGEGDEGLLSTIRLYDRLRQDLPEDFLRAEGSNVDVLTLPTGEEYAFCHLATIWSLTRGDKVPQLAAHEEIAVVAMAVQDLNTGDGFLIPEVEGLPDRCRVRFTTEFADDEYDGGIALAHVVENLRREKGGTAPRPCAFLSAVRSKISIPTSIVTGVFGYPQLSSAATSADLDDKSQYPLFGRTIPPDNGNAIPIILYIRNVLQVQHLAVLNVNDAYGNAYVEGMRKAIHQFAPDMVLDQVPLDSDDGIPAAVEALKATTFRFIFAIVFTTQTHDAIMEEGVRQGVAGDGYHNWLFPDSFPGTLEGRTFPAGGTLHRAYRGSGLLEVAGGVPGLPSFDRFEERIKSLHNSQMDMDTLGEKFPTINVELGYNARELFTAPGNTFLKDTVESGYAQFMYEAAIGLGLAACEASNAGPNGLDFNGVDHFEYFKKSNFTAFSGKMVINEFGSRDATFALYKVTNYVAQSFTDDTGQEMVRFDKFITDVFKDGVWNQEIAYVYNDGTTNLPDDLPPAESDNSTILAVIVVVPIMLLVGLAIGAYIYLENKRRANDTVWVVAREDIKFADPPVIIGSGTFGLVLLGEYRGTQVAVKRVLPPKTQKEGKEGSTRGGESSVQQNGSGALFDPRPSVSGVHATLASGVNPNLSGVNPSISSAQSRGLMSTTTAMLGNVADGINTGLGTVGHMVGFGHMSLSAGKKKSRESEAQVWRRMKKEFMSEMRYLSKLRHPCITTVMGAVTSGEPMLIMEYMDHGSLYDLLHNETMVLDGEIALPLLKDITQGLRFLHSADPQVIHGDLKAANILVDNRFRAKVADFGLSQKQNLGGTGTPYWMAPELLRMETSNTAQSDIYSFGIILYEVFSRRDPYEGENYDEVIKLIADKNVQKRPPPPRHMPEAIQVLMKDCIEDDPEKRPDCGELDIRLKRIDAAALNSSQDTNRKGAQVSLFDIFPRHIAEALRDGRTVEAEHKECVTIFFSDIVGFTNISSELEPRKVAGMLDRLYTRFDALSNQHDIFKVETIGDAYMAVTNLIKDQEEDHAKRIAEFAIDAIAAANETIIDPDNEEKGYVNIRVGFHSGSVVADVVGTRNPRYCLFGDTVNTASRMESNSEQNRIHCSRAAAKILQKQMPELPLRSRGKITIKGKGSMYTYWVNEKGSRGSSNTSALKLNRAISGLDDSATDFGEDEEVIIEPAPAVQPPPKDRRKSHRFSAMLSKMNLSLIQESSQELTTGPRRSMRSSGARRSATRSQASSQVSSYASNELDLEAIEEARDPQPF